MSSNGLYCKKLQSKYQIYFCYNSALVETCNKLLVPNKKTENKIKRKKERKEERKKIERESKKENKCWITQL